MESLLSAILVLVIAEIRSLAPWIAKSLVNASVEIIRSLKVASRMEEEWLRDISDAPGRLYKVVIALGTLVAAGRILVHSLKQGLKYRKKLNSILDLDDFDADGRLLNDKLISVRYDIAIGILWSTIKSLGGPTKVLRMGRLELESRANVRITDYELFLLGWCGYMGDKGLSRFGVEVLWDLSQRVKLGEQHPCMRKEQ